MTAPYRLYGRQGSGSLAVQVALEEIGVSYERIWIGKETAEVGEFRKLSPTGKVPALALPDGTLIFESAAILIHLSLAHPDAGLAPLAGTTDHGRFLQWMVFMAANLYEAALRMYYSARYSTGGEMHAEAIRDQGTRDFLAHIRLMDQSLAPYLLGATYSIADAYLYMLASWFPGGKAQLHKRFAALMRHDEMVGLRAALIKVEADHAG